MVRSDKKATFLWYAAAFFFALCVGDTTVSAQFVTMEDFTGFFADTTVAPTVRPTQRPTQRPTARPTQRPTAGPTQRPTQRPTARPTQRPTQRPTANPTDLPSVAPSDVPTDSPTVPATMSLMSLFPKITFNVIFLEEFVLTEVESFFADFVESVFQEISTVYDLNFSRLAPNIIVSSSSFSTRSYSISIDGVVYFFNEIPTMVALDRGLNDYFSLLGTSGMESKFNNAGLEDVDITSIYIGDEKVIVDGEEDGGKQNIFLNAEGELSKRNIISLYVGFVLAVVMITLIVCRYKIYHRCKQEKRESGSHTSDSSISSAKQIDLESGIDSKLNSSSSSRHSSEMTEKPSSDGSEDKGENKLRRTSSTSSRRSQVMKKRIKKLDAKSKALAKLELKDTQGEF